MSDKNAETVLSDHADVYELATICGHKVAIVKLGSKSRIIDLLFQELGEGVDCRVLEIPDSPSGFHTVCYTGDPEAWSSDRLNVRKLDSLDQAAADSRYWVKVIIEVGEDRYTAQILQPDTNDTE